MFSSRNATAKPLNLAKPLNSANPLNLAHALVQSALALSLGAALTPALAQSDRSFDKFPGIGRAATPKEITAWDIDVRPDFKGLPKGSGSVAQGQGIWEAKCASCHGVFGESNQVFSPLVGGTTKDDVKTGRVARLTDEGFPGRTTFMKVPTLSTVWDYINRAMPWTQPKSLTPDEVYAVTAFLLNLSDIVPEDFVLSDKNMAQTQALMPNRLGMTTDHALWPGKPMGKGSTPSPKNTKADVQAVACMSNCATETSVKSFLPDFARNAHGNLAEQNRGVGAQRGANTAVAAPLAALPATPTATPPTAKPPAAPVKAGDAPADAAAVALLSKHTCVACHGVANKIVGPSFKDVANKYGAGGSDALARKIKQGGSGVWGQIPMPPQALPEADAKAIADWISRGAKP